jgi:DNA-binding transcriptional ArsR family regulator
MDVTILDKLDPVFETIMLLNLGYEIDKLKETVVSQLNDLGGNGDSIFQKLFKEYEKYVCNFNKFRVKGEGEDFYFKDTSFEFYIYFVSPFFLNKDLIANIYQMNNDQVLELLYERSEEIFDIKLPVESKNSYEEFKKINNMISFVNSMHLNESDKWKMFLVFQNPLDYYRHFADIIKDNNIAYEKAVLSVKPSIDKYMKAFSKSFSTEKLNSQLSIGMKIKDDIHMVIPSMALALGVLINTRECYYGLLVDKIYAEIGQKNNNQEYLIGCLKALSDNSKFEILMSLKVCPKYATELAEQLSLTTATVSHHMNTLLTYQLVILEKENGKIYYHINEPSINNFLEQLSLIILK